MQNRFEKAVNYYRQGHYEGALNEANLILDSLPNDIDANLLIAAIHAAQSDYLSVVSRCESVLNIAPNDERASYNAAVASQMLGEYENAIRFSRQIKPGAQSYRGARLVLISSLHESGEIQSAKKESISLLKKNKGLTEVYLHLSRFFRSRKDYKLSNDICLLMEKDCQASDDIQVELAYLNFDKGMYEKAQAYINKVLSKSPLQVQAVLVNIKLIGIIDNHHAVLNYLLNLKEKFNDIGAELQVELGISYFNVGVYSMAMQVLSECQKANVNLEAVFHYMGDIYELNNDYDKALLNYEKSLAVKPNSVPTLYNMGLVLEKKNDFLRAINYTKKCLDLSNQHVYKHALVRQLSFVDPDSVNKYEQLVTDLLCDDSVDAQDLSSQIIQYIRINVSVVDELIIFALDNNFERFSDLLKRQALHDLCKSNLFKIVLANVLINDYDFELFITMLRRFFLVNTNQSVILEKNERELCAAISIQCVFNGFILVTRDDEQIVLDKMIDSYDSSGISTDKDVLNLVMISMYIQLSKLLNNKCLDLNMKLIDHGSLIEIMYKYHMLDPVYESKIQVDIINDIEIIDDTSVSVMNMYESSPYPVWKKLNVPLTRSIENIIKDINPEFNLDLPYEGLPDILVAGCGTGRHAILNAMQIQNREVIAIDLSTSSLAYAIRMAEEHSVQNIQFKHMDILNVSELSRQFDVIESVGVLHHMDKPEVGLRSLVDNLKPGGLINIGLYSTIGRRYIKEAKERYHADGKVLSDMEVHTARHDIMRSTNNDMRVNLSGFCDFYSLHECRDMLFHISEHTYTLNEVSSLIDDAGLVFIGFSFTETTTPLAYKKMFPDDPLMTDLKNWSEFEKVNLDAFVSMYVFWCYKPV